MTQILIIEDDKNMAALFEEFMKDEDRKDFGPSVCVIVKRYLKMRSATNGVNEK